MSSYSDLEVSSSSKFLKIEAGTPHQLRLLGEAKKRISHWINKKQTSCTVNDCLNCASGDKARESFKVNVYDHTSNTQMIWEFGTSIARQIKEIDKTLATDGQDVTMVDLKVSASGSGMQKKYMVMPWLPPKPLPEGLKLFSLTEDVPF